MFVGHLAVAFIGKRAAPSVSLGWHMAAVTALDLIWPFLLLAGIETVTIQSGATAFTPFVFDSYPWSHSLVMSAVWAALFYGLARWRGASKQASLVLGALVVSHWVLDFVSHAPDMPLWPGNSPRLGLGLWNSIPATLVVEGLLWTAGIAIYLKLRRPLRWQGVLAFWSFVVVCTLLWVAGPWSPPPPSVRSLAWFGLIGWLVIPWSAWADRHTAPRQLA